MKHRQFTVTKLSTHQTRLSGGVRRYKRILNRAHKPLFRLFLVCFFVCIAVIPNSRSTSAEKQKLELQVQAQQRSIQKLSTALTDTQKAKAASDAELTKKASESTQKQSEIDSLNKQLQAKADEKARIASAPVGYGGDFVGTGANAGNYAWGNCTFLVASLLPIPAGWGNANTWDDNARAMGYQVSSEPSVNSVAQTDAGYYGHVAIVEEVGDGQVLIKEMNVLGLGVIDERWVPTSDYKYIVV